VADIKDLPLPDSYFSNTHQFYDAVMMFAHATSAMLTKGTSLREARRAAAGVLGPDLFKQLTQTDIFASQGRIVIDGAIPSLSLWLVHEPGFPLRASVDRLVLARPQGTA
jgi:hypothetical protein